MRPLPDGYGDFAAATAVAAEPIRRRGVTVAGRAAAPSLPGAQGNKAGDLTAARPGGPVNSVDTSAAGV
ncbi:hypothetical protein ABZY45_12390 [Streptomyces sp. NPDC006516]|uniref:hypothetical protein n=1 Tax=Streptomyces sp. NPDC006516 TaxID=3154309 RepID=UPI0033B37767